MLIRIYDNTVQAEVFRLLGRKVRFAAIGILTLALLAPFLSGFAVALEAGSSCPMSCCKAAKAACHRHGNGGTEQSSGWHSRPQCSTSCGQLAITSAGGWGVSTGALHADPPPAESRLQCSIQSPRRYSGAEFALFERPPPFCG
jgi:hypothetical protein